MEDAPVASTSTAGRAERDYSRLLLRPTNVTPSPLTGTRDLITQFHLDSLYNTFLRPYLPPSTTAGAAASNNVPPPPPASADSPQTTVKGAVSIKGKERASAPVGSPAPPYPPATVASPAPGAGAGGGGGFKITLGGIKLNSSSSSFAATAAASGGGLPTPTGKVKRVKMEKNYSHMVQDILGRNSIKKDQYLSHLVQNPDPAPCPPLVCPDAQLLRDGLTLKVGGLAGFDMSMWENPPPGGGGGDGGGYGGDGAGERKKKKKRKHVTDGGTLGGGDGGGTGSERKKQRYA